MGVVDFILNLAGLLLWIDWRSVKMDHTPTALSLVSTLKRTEPERKSRWASLIAIPILLVGRSIFYWQIGPDMNWTPQLSFGAVVISFYSAPTFSFLSFTRVLFFSFLSFLISLLIFYSWICLLCGINGRSGEKDSFHRLACLHLGWFGAWPGYVVWILPLLVAGASWIGLGALFGQARMMPPPVDLGHAAQQACLVACGLILSWKYLLFFILALFWINTYVYLGGSAFWNYVNLTGRNLLWPLRWCRAGKIDLSPPLGIAIVGGLSELGAKWLPLLYQRLPF